MNVLRIYDMSEILKPLIKTWLPREAYSYKDKGVIIIKNNMDEATQVKVFCKEPFVIFDKTIYEVEEELQIPFIIKLPALQSAQLIFRRVPSLSAKIEVVASYKDKQIKKILSLTAGEW